MTTCWTNPKNVLRGVQLADFPGGPRACLGNSSKGYKANSIVLLFLRGTPMQMEMGIMKTFNRSILAVAIAGCSSVALAGPVKDVLGSLGLGGVQLSTAAKGLPSQINSGLSQLGLSSANVSTLVGVTVFEPAGRLNAELLGLSVGSGDDTGNGRLLGGVAVLAGKNSGNGGAIGIGALSEGNNGRGDLISVRALNADEALALGLGGQDIPLIPAIDPVSQLVDPLNGGDLNEPLQDLLGRENGIGGALYDGLTQLQPQLTGLSGQVLPGLDVIREGAGELHSAGAALGENNPTGQALLFDEGGLAVQLLGANNLANDGILGVTAIAGNNTSNTNELAGLGVLTGDTSANGSGLAGVAALTGNTAGNENGLLGAGVLTGNTTGNNNIAGLGVITGNTTANGNEAAGIAVLSGNDAANGNGLLGAAVLTGNNAANGLGVLGAAVLTGDNAANGNDIGAAVLTGDNAGNAGLIGAAALTGNNGGTGDLVGAGVLTGDNSGNGGLVGLGVLTGDNSATGGIVNISALSGEGSSQGGLINVGVLNNGGGLLSTGGGSTGGSSNGGSSSGSNGGGLINGGVLNGGESSGGGLISIGAIGGGEGTGGTGGIPTGFDPNSDTESADPSEGCSSDPRATFRGLAMNAGPQLSTRFSSPKSQTEAGDCSVPNASELALGAN